MTLNEAVAFRIKQLCKEKKLSLCALAERSGVSERTLKEILRAPSERKIRFSTILKICSGFDVSVYYFFKAKEFESLD